MKKSKQKIQKVTYTEIPDTTVYCRDKPTTFEVVIKSTNDVYEETEISVFGRKGYTKEWQKKPLLTLKGFDENSYLTVSFSKNRIEKERTVEICASDVSTLYVALGEFLRNKKVSLEFEEK